MLNKKDNIRYRFTGYVLAALKRAKRDYICREIKISGHESPLEELLPEPLCDITDSKPFLWEETEKIPLTSDEVRQYLESQIMEFKELLHSNAHLIYKYAVNGGIKIA